MDEIGPSLIRPILEGCKAHGAWAGIHVKGNLSALFEFAVIRGLAEGNPIPGLHGLLRAPVSQSRPSRLVCKFQAFYQKAAELSAAIRKHA
ncbi:hypothetical protein [Burkholderia cepacia]|uniref:hypothetical protein n=1 Tax=Burkholderia cepacia TaxID=292 RepID=UPI002ABE67F3|nr:hypothetical protein [Burkholderia cepacia]